MQAEGGVLHIDKSRIEASQPDQFDDLRVGDDTDISSESQAPLGAKCA